MLRPGKHLVVALKSLSQILTGRIRRVGNYHGFHVFDFLQSGLVVFQLELQFFHFQPLPLQLQVVQGGVKAHEKITLLHRIPLGNQDPGDLLGFGKEYGLNPVRGHGAVAFLGVPPEFRHAHIVKGKDRHRVPALAGQAEDNAHHNGHRQHHCHSGNEQLPCLTAQLLHGRLLPRYAARRPEYDRSCWRWPRFPAHG